MSATPADFHSSDDSSRPTVGQPNGPVLTDLSQPVPSSEPNQPQPGESAQSGFSAQPTPSAEADRSAESDRLSQEAATRLAESITAVATGLAAQEAELLKLVGEFDAQGASGWFEGITSTAHWLAWQCGFAPGTARERVRVARALREMPHTAELFGQGLLSYAKVRELSRLVGQVDEAEPLRSSRGRFGRFGYPRDAGCPRSWSGKSGGTAPTTTWNASRSPCPAKRPQC